MPLLAAEQWHTVDISFPANSSQKFQIAAARDMRIAAADRIGSPDIERTTAT
jgi:hypothetical protein